MERSISLSFRHRVHFAHDVLASANPLLADVVAAGTDPTRLPVKVLAFLDTHVARAMPALADRLRDYVAAHAGVLTLAGRVQPVVGGELAKNDRDAIYRVLQAIDEAHLDRQSCILAVGGGAVLDCVGFAAAIAHRGIRLVRMPTTTLAQADSGVGVKNGINAFGKKNFLGSFAVPWGVVNDATFLKTLPDREWRGGFAEAVKVAIVKDAAFFAAIEAAASAIAARDMAASWPIIQRSAELHLDHIALSGDPFELTAARPLDFGHWLAHRLEAMTGYSLRHGEAVAIGLAVDTRYAAAIGLIPPEAAERVERCLQCLGFALSHPVLADTDAVLQGLEEFREHLGGELTITLPSAIGRGIEVHTMNHALLRELFTQPR